MRLTGDGRGHIKATGIVVDQLGPSNRLDFQLDFDQTQLSRLIRELNAMLVAFPVVGE